MKSKRIVWAGLMILLGMGMMEVGVGKLRAATNDASGLLQQGLFEEEANHNLDAAITAYQAVVTQTEKDRQFEATAIFRLGECYRKLGRTNEANVQYQRIVSEFADQTELAALSRQYLPSMVTAGPTVPPASNAASQTQQELLAEQIKLEEQQVQRQEDLVKVGVMPEADTVPTKEKLLELRRQMVALGLGPPATALESGQPATAGTTDEEAAELKRIQALTKDSPDLINGGFGETPPLINAAMQDYLNVARFLLDNHADVNVVHARRTAISLATEQGHKEMVELLLDRGADVNDPSSARGFKPLQIAALRGYRAIAEVLLAHKADINIGSGVGYTPLYCAAQSGFQSVAELLLANGADVNARGPNDQSPLYEAAGTDNVAMIELLIAHKADVNATAQDGTTPLILAAKNGRVQVAQVLIANHANVNAQATGGAVTGWRPLDFAVDAGQNDLVKLLLDNEADPNAVIPTYYSDNNNASANQFHGPDTTSYHDCTPLLMTAINPNDRTETARLLIAHQANVNIGDKNGLSPLTLAAKNQRKELAELLLAHGADVNARDNSGQSPLSGAVRSQSVEMVKLILAHKPNLEIQDQNHLTPLQTAGSPEIATLLLDAGAAPDSVYPPGTPLAGMTPIEVAISESRWARVDLLLKHKADPNFRDANGNTPLSHVKEVERFAANDPTRMTKLEEVEVLLQKAGANENLQRLAAISVSRGGVDSMQTVFKTNALNHYTLLDLLETVYAPPLRGSYYPAGGGFATRPGPTTLDNSHLPGLAFPDFSRVSISRMGRDGKTKRVTVDLAKLLDDGDCSQNVPLAWGDVVEIPEAEHNVSKVWPGLSSKDRSALAKCLTINVRILIKGRTNALSLTPYWYSGRGSAQPMVGPGAGTVADLQARQASRTHFRQSVAPGRATDDGDQVVELSSFWLSDVVSSANVLLTSSDLSRVKVWRVDPATGKPVEMVFDLRQVAERGTDNSPVARRTRSTRPGESPTLSPEQQMILVEAQRDDALRQGAPQPRLPDVPQATPAGSADGTQGDNLWLRDGDVIEVPEKPE